MCNRRFNFAVVLLSFGAVFLASLVNGGGMSHKMKCLGTEVDLKECMKGFFECAGTILPAEDVTAFKDPNTPAEKKKEIGMKAHKNLCVRACQWKKYQHLLNDDGSLNSTGQDAMVEKFPEAAREGLKTGVAKCHADSSKDFKDDDQCASYKPFEECMKKTYMEVCKIEAKEVHMDNME